MIDSHCHLDHEPMFSDLKNVINRSKENGLEKILSICTTNDSFKKILEIIKFDPIIYGTFGIHPHESDKEFVSKSEIISKIKTNKKKISFISKGDDYQILFTSSKSNRRYIKSLFKRMNQKVTLIGDLTNEIKSNQIVHNKNLIKHRNNEGYTHNF